MAASVPKEDITGNASQPYAIVKEVENDAKNDEKTNDEIPTFNVPLGSRLPKEAFVVKDEDNDPLNLVKGFVGLWGNKPPSKGKDIVFEGLDAVNNGAGYTTPYVENWTCTAAPGIVLNPSKFNSKERQGSEGEILYGVRFVREVWSDLPLTDNNNKKDSPFKGDTIIHFETGYILFSYYGNPGDKSSQKLKRVVKTLAVPRATTVLARDDNPVIKMDKETGSPTEFTFTLKADAASAENLVWVVGNGEFSSKTAKVTSFSQQCKFTWINGGIESTGGFLGSTFEYVQQTPLKFISRKGQPETTHTNSNTLTKGNYPVPT